MDPILARNIYYGITFLGSFLVLVGGVGSFYYTGVAEKAAPYKHPIRMAAATVEVTLKSDEQINTHYADRGGGIAFLRKGEPLLVMEDYRSNARQLGNERLVFRGDFMMDPKDVGAGKDLSSLKNADEVQIHFLKMKEGAEVVEGNVICIVNSSVRFEFGIPPQVARNGFVRTNDLTTAFRDFP